MTIWTDELTERAIQLWNAGQSATTIAAALGGNISRNAVIGKLNRLQEACDPRLVRTMRRKKDYALNPQRQHFLTDEQLFEIMAYREPHDGEPWTFDGIARVMNLSRNVVFRAYVDICRDLKESEAA